MSIGNPVTFYEISEEIDRLYDWNIAIYDGTLIKTQRTKQKIDNLAAYWVEKLDRIIEAEKFAREEAIAVCHD